jgi:hypothetical protein
MFGACQCGDAGGSDVVTIDAGAPGDVGTPEAGLLDRVAEDAGDSDAVAVDGGGGADTGVGADTGTSGVDVIADGCAAMIPGNCCGAVCPSAEHASPVCSGGTCTIACMAGYANCDGALANGCEMSLATSDAHCGACNVACTTGQRCEAGACTRPLDAGVLDGGTGDVPVDGGPSCVPATEVFNSRDDDCDGLIDEGFSVDGVSLACAGNGRIITIPDRDIDDGGFSSDFDGLEYYCINRIYRFCLTGEACPWRGGTPPVDSGESCSSAGLRGPAYFMAYYITGYFQVGSARYDEWYCPPTGRVRLARR